MEGTSKIVSNGSAPLNKMAAMPIYGYPPAPPRPPPKKKQKKKKQQQKNKRPMGHYLLTCIFANAMQQSSSIATTTGTQIWTYHKKVKGHPSLIFVSNLVDLESPSPMLYTMIHPRSFLKLVLENKIFKCFFHEPFEQSCNIP